MHKWLTNQMIAFDLRPGPHRTPHHTLSNYQASSGLSSMGSQPGGENSKPRNKQLTLGSGAH